MMRKSLLFPLFCFAIAAAAAESPVDPYRAAIEAGIRAGVYRDVAFGRIEGKERSAFFAGGASAESRFELGALTEAFTGTLLAQTAYEGRVRLQTSLRERLPQVSFADAGLGAATLDALATHQIVVPAVPPNLMPDDAEDPYASYGALEMRALLANYRMPREAHAEYSPLQFGLIGYALSGTSDGFSTLLRDKVLNPLALKHSGFDDEGLLDAHARGIVARHWHFGALAASGGLRSTMGDLLDFLQANLQPDKSPLRAALLLARQPRQPDNVALGWNIKSSGSGEQSWPVLWRASVTGGFSAFMGFRTDRQRAVVLLGDTDHDLSPIGMAILEELPPPPPQARATESDEHAAALSDYTGLYKIGGGAELVVREHQQTLWLQLHGEPAVRLFNDGDDMFDGGLHALSVSFQREPHTVTSLLLSHAGVNLLARRLTLRAPHLVRAAVVADANVLNEVVGDYQLGTNMLLRIVRRGDNAVMQVTARTAVPLFAFASERFACEDESCELALRRDTQQRIVGLDVDFAGGQRFAERISWSKP